jgi:MFS family permease
MDFVFSSASSKARLGPVITPSSGTQPQVYCVNCSDSRSQWYMPHEVTFRMSLYSIAAPAGAMLSGALQGALSTNFEGMHGREGWRWAFIINVSLYSTDRVVYMLIRQGRLHNHHCFSRIRDPPRLREFFEKRLEDFALTRNSQSVPTLWPVFT